MSQAAHFSITTLDQIGASVWDSVTKGRALPTQQYVWTAAAAETYADGPETKVAIVGPTAAPRALTPLGREPNEVGRLGWLGADTLAEGFEVIASDEEARRALATGLVQLNRPLSFGHYPGDTPWIDEIRTAAKGRALVVARAREERCFPMIALSSAWDDPVSQMLSRASDHKRKAKAAAKLGAISFEAVEPSAYQLTALMDEVLLVEARNWKGRAGSAVLCNPRFERFYRRYAELACKAGILRLFFLRIGGETAAVQLAVETENAFWQHKIGYDEKFQKVSPGNLLMAETIRWSVRRGLGMYHFMGKDAPWTRDWTQHSRPCTALRTYPLNPLGALAACRDGAGLAWRAAQRRLFSRRA